MTSKRLPPDTVIHITYENLLGAVSATCLYALMNPLPPELVISHEELAQRCEAYAAQLIHEAFLEQEE